MAAMAAERTIFENEDWIVTESGLEHKTTGYFIDRESLANRRSDGFWTWPLHMAEKSWCEMTPFAEAFCCAASVYDIETGADLAQTFRMARSEIVVWPQQAKQNPNPAPRVRPLLKDGIVNPISWETGLPGKSLRDQDSRALDENTRRQGSIAARGYSAKKRLREPHPAMTGVATLPWRTSRRIHRTGTKLVRLLQAAWSIR